MLSCPCVLCGWLGIALRQRGGEGRGQATVWQQTQWSAEGDAPAFTAGYDPGRVSQRVREREELVSRLQYGLLSPSSPLRLLLLLLFYLHLPLLAVVAFFSFLLWLGFC